MREPEPQDHQKSGDPHLRSANEVKGYLVNGIKEENSSFGHIHDFVFDMDTWTIRYLVLDTVKFLPSKKVLLSPTWVSSMPWHSHEVHVRSFKEKIKSAPEYNTDSPPNRQYEEDLHTHYGKAFYLEGLPERKKTPAA